MADSRPAVVEQPSEHAKAFLRLADLHLDAAYRLARAILRDPTEAQDATHDAFVHRDGGTGLDIEHAGDLFVVEAEGGEPRQLNPAGTVAAGFDGVGFNPASWSPDGASVAFGGLDVDGADGESAVFVTDTDTLASRQVSAWRRWDVYARWSPTGDWIAFDASPRVAGTRLVSIVKPDGTGERTLTELDGRACCVDWSPDGRFLVHQRGPERSSDLWVMDIEGHAIQVTDTPGTYLAVWWLR
jgi:Tol biopolymer transport system component